LRNNHLQAALDEAENNLQCEESKVQRAQIEVQAIRNDIEKRIAEKEEEFEATRMNHQRAIDSVQVSRHLQVNLPLRRASRRRRAAAPRSPR